MTSVSVSIVEVGLYVLFLLTIGATAGWMWRHHKDIPGGADRRRFGDEM